MRLLWNIVSFLAVVHLLTLFMLTGWFWYSGVLTADRLSEARRVFAAVPLPGDESTQALTREAAEPIASVPSTADGLDSGAVIQQVALVQQREEQMLRRLEHERQMLRQQLEATAARMSEKELEFQRRLAELESATAANDQRRNDEQFLRVLKYFEQLTPKQGKQMLIAMIEQDRSHHAIEYLNAMNPRAAAKILREFKNPDEIILATELLQRLRTHSPSSAPTESPPALAAVGQQDAGNAIRPDRDR